MDQVLLDFMRHVRNQYASTTYARTLWEIGSFEKFLQEKKIDVYAVTKENLEEYLRSMTCSDDTRRHHLLALHHLYDFLKVPDNPAAQIRMRPLNRITLFKEPHREQIGETLARLAHPQTELELRNRLIFELFYGSGIRRAELVRLNIDDVDLLSGTMRVLGKGNKMRIVPITAIAADILRRYCAARHATCGPLLVSFMGRRLLAASINLICSTKIGIRPHLLRHACASHMLKNGCDIRHIQELLGHEELTTTQLYTHINKQDLKELLNRLHPRAAIPPGTGKSRTESPETAL
jgi:integrase/recombinase XerC